MGYQGMRAALAASVAIYAVAAAAPAWAQTKSFNVPAQSAATGIPELARQADIQVLVSESAVRGKTTRRVKGRMSAEQALRRLIAGTGLQIASSDGRTFTLSASTAAVTPQPATGGPVSPGTGGAETASSSGTVDDAEESEEIVVTAQKREERLIEVPLSITVLSAEKLFRTGASQLRDFQDTVPGLTVQSGGPGFSRLSLRGVTVGLDSGSTVGVYVDGVPYGSSTPLARGGQITLDSALFDLERLEILRGPQGTLYGASTLGGLLQYVTVRPDPSTFAVDLRAGLSDTAHGEMSYNIAGVVNAPIVTDKVALRLSGFYNRDGGYIDNIALGEQDVNRSTVYGGRADLMLQPTERLAVRISAFFQNVERDGVPFADFNLNGSPVTSSLQQRRVFPEPFDQKYRLVSGTINYDLDFAELTSITSYQHTKASFIFDYTPVFGGIARIFVPAAQKVGVLDNSQTKKFTQELRLSSAGENMIDWIVGGYYTDETSEYSQQMLLRDAGDQPITNNLFKYTMPTSYEEIAAFGNITVHLSEKFDITAGLRYAHNRQKSEQIGASTLIGSVPPVRFSENVFTYLANARYHFNDRATVYARYATGYRPGGPNFVGRTPAGGTLGEPRYEADRLQSYEVGFKAETADQKFAVDLAAYYIDWNNIQITVSRGGGFNGRDNSAAGAEIRGMELNLTARPTRDFTVSGAFAYQDAKLSAADPDLKGDKGERLPVIPRFTAAISADYELRDNALRPSIGATLRFTDDRTGSFDRSTSFPQYHLPDYTAVDLRAGMRLGQFRVQGYVRNLFDTRAQVSPLLNLYPLAGPISVSILQPRTIGLNVQTSF